MKVSFEKANAALELSSMDRVKGLDSATQHTDPSCALQSLHHRCWGFGGNLGDLQALFRPFAQRSFSLWKNVKPSCAYELFISDSIHFSA